MEIINPDNSKTDININNLDDYLSLQLQKQEEIINFFKRYGMYIWAFTLDSKSQGGGFFNLPDENKLKLDFIINMGAKIEQLTNGEFLLIPKKFLEEKNNK